MISLQNYTLTEVTHEKENKRKTTDSTNVYGYDISHYAGARSESDGVC